MASNAVSTRYSLAQMDDVLAAFRRKYPEFDSTSRLDDLRATEYQRLDEQEHIYLDYTGGGLYAESQLRAHLDLLSRHVFGNPHSENPTSRHMTELAERARAYVLKYFNATPEEYVAIFTSNASGALKLVGESYPFAPGAQYLLTYDNHNSVNGIREYARLKGAAVTYVPVAPPDLRVNEADLLAALDQPAGSGPRLFSYPAQSNFSGVQHPLEWIEVARAKGWDVLVDCAAFVPTNRLDLGRCRPDFIPLSFYKIFGYPTGVGCLLARREALKKLQRPWFAGGSIWAVSVESERLFMADDEAAFEDGTINYLTLPAVEIGLKHIEAIGVETIHTRVLCLTGWLIEQLLSLRHSNGAALVQVYGPRDCRMRGGTIALNFFDPDGKVVDERVVDRRASDWRISLRTGCFCNPGGGELALGFSAEELSACFIRHNEDRLTLDEFRRCIDDKSTGAVRISTGLASTFADVYVFARFAASFLDMRAHDLMRDLA